MVFAQVNRCLNHFPLPFIQWDVVNLVVVTCSIVLVVMHFTNAVLIGLAKDFVNMQV